MKANVDLLATYSITEAYFRETRQRSCKIQVIGQVILSIVVLTDYSWLFLIATDKHQCLNDIITISFKPNLIKYEK